MSCSVSCQMIFLNYVYPISTVNFGEFQQHFLSFQTPPWRPQRRRRRQSSHFRNVHLHKRENERRSRSAPRLLLLSVSSSGFVASRKVSMIARRTCVLCAKNKIAVHPFNPEKGRKVILFLTIIQDGPSAWIVGLGSTILPDSCQLCHLPST